MSFNIDRIEILKQDDFRIEKDVYDRLLKEYEDGENLPEDHLLYPDWIDKQNHISVAGKGSIWPIEIWWSGTYSGRTYEHLKKILSHFLGWADLAVHWEGGSVEVLKVRDGKVTCHDAVIEAQKDPATIGCSDDALLQLTTWNLATLEQALDNKRTPKYQIDRAAEIAWQSLRYARSLVHPNKHNKFPEVNRWTKHLLVDSPEAFLEAFKLNSPYKLK